MSKKQSECLKYFQFITLTQVPPTLTADKKSVLGFFKEAAHPIPPDQRISEPNALILDAYKKNLMTWEQLAVILKERVQYLQFYWQRIQRGLQPKVRKSDDDVFFSPEAVEIRKKEYVEVISQLAAQLLDSSQHTVLKNLPFAEGRRKDYWVAEEPLFGSLEPAVVEVAESYEKGLLVDKDFRDEAEELQKTIAAIAWFYTYETDFLSTDGIGDRSRSENNRKCLKMFCRRWCLKRLEFNKLAGKRWKVVAMRVRSEESPDGTGISAFIPRYYGFNHINRHHATDFAGLKYHLDTMFASPRKRPDIESEADKKARARAYRNKCLKAGLPRSLAWDMTFYKMHHNWSYSTMRTHMGERPKSSLNGGAETIALATFLVKEEMISFNEAITKAKDIAMLGV